MDIIDVNASDVNSSVGFANGTRTDYVSYELRLETYIVPIIFFIIFVVGALGNGTLIRIFIRHKTMRNVPNTYIFSLALGDLLVIIISVPFTSTIYTVESWPYGVLICKISESAKDVSIGVSVFTLTALSADRFFAIVDPMKKLHSGGCGKRATSCTMLTIASIWTLAILLALPAAIFSYLKRLTINSETVIEVCYPFPEEGGEWTEWYPRAVVLAKFVVYYSTPLFVISFFYILMARHLVLSTRNLPGESGRQIRARKKVAKMVLAFVLIFAICFLPQHIFMIWFYNYPNAQEEYNAFWHTLRLVGFFLSYINSCINPIALFCVSGTFRKYFNRYLFCCCANQLSRSASISMTSTKRLGTMKTSVQKRNGESFSYSQSKGRHTLIPEVTITTFMNGGNGTIEVCRT